jgi:hypothetical protein
MNCPSCESPLQAGAAACATCGASLDTYRLRFGAIPRFGAYVTDTTGQELIYKEFMAIERMLKSFERRFPQSRFSFFMAKLSPSTKPREYAFWLMNECRFVPPECRLGANLSLLLLMDIGSMRGCLMTGYGLEAYLSEEDLSHILQAGKTHFARRHYVPAVRKCVAATSHILERRARNPMESFATQPHSIPSSATLIPGEAVK